MSATPNANPTRPRLSEIKSQRHLLPFVRATAIEDISLYWLPVNEFPIPFRQRRWILALMDRLCEDLKRDKQTVEQFLQLKSTRSELNERFINTLQEHRPMTGLLLEPGGSLPSQLTIQEVTRLTENPGPEGLLDLDHLSPDFAVWFAGPQAAEQRVDFFGVGGMVFIWIDEGGEAAPPKVEIPRFLSTHPAMKGVDIEAQMRSGLRLQHPFLARSREIFATPLPDGPLKRYSLFVLPLFSTRHLIEATPDERKAWFEIFSAYCTESRKDKGVVLALREPDFDERLIALIEATVADVGEFPL